MISFCRILLGYWGSCRRKRAKSWIYFIFYAKNQTSRGRALADLITFAVIHRTRLSPRQVASMGAVSEGRRTILMHEWFSLEGDQDSFVEHNKCCGTMHEDENRCTILDHQSSWQTGALTLSLQPLGQGIMPLGCFILNVFDFNLIIFISRVPTNSSFPSCVWL